MKIATIEKIKDIKPHPNAELLELATVNGWQVVVKKETYRAGDWCIYVTIDSITADLPQYEFLRNKEFKIRTIKLRGEISQGILFPISLLSEFGYSIDLIVDEFSEGKEISNLIGVSHYEKPVPAQLAGDVVGYRPEWIKKTDEENIKSCPEVLGELKGKPYVITAKMDGSSCTFFVKDGTFGVCSRSMNLKPSENNSFWRIAKEYDIENKIKSYFPNKNIAVQGELYGPGINKNRVGATKLKFAAFNLFDIDAQKYLSYPELNLFCVMKQIPEVPLVETGIEFNYTLEKLQEIANFLKYETENIAEGIVIRPITEVESRVLKGRLSGKIISEAYELKYG